MITSRNALILLLIATLFTQTACQALKPKKVDAKDFPPDPRERVKKNIEEGRGFRVMGGDKGGTNYEFASANPLWRATLDTLDFMPLVSANYSGGIVVTDWYSENNTPNESVKISVRFLTNEIRSDALDINVFFFFSTAVTLVLNQELQLVKISKVSCLMSPPKVRYSKVIIIGFIYPDLHIFSS